MNHLTRTVQSHFRLMTSTTRTLPGGAGHKTEVLRHSTCTVQSIFHHYDPHYLYCSTHLPSYNTDCSTHLPYDTDYSTQLPSYDKTAQPSFHHMTQTTQPSSHHMTETAQPSFHHMTQTAQPSFPSCDTDCSTQLPSHRRHHLASIFPAPTSVVY